MTTPTTIEQAALQWHRMTARERDWHVAKHVMGWLTSKGGALIRPGGDPARIADYADPPRYTTNPEACAQVIEAMRARAFSVMITAGPIGTGGWASQFTSRETYPERFTTFADTMPEAVAVSALRACGVTVETGDL